MEAPEKIYVTESMLFMTNPEITLQGNGNKLEYTRTDAFIEKAEKAMIEWAGTYVSKTTGGGVRERKVLATDLLNYFKKYIRGE
jgi:hypothetical protein